MDSIKINKLEIENVKRVKAVKMEPAANGLIQHLKGYATTNPLNQECIDPRYKYVAKGCAPTFEQLSGKWAVPGYSRGKYASLEAAREAKDSYGDHTVQLLGRAVKIPRSMFAK